MYQFFTKKNYDSLTIQSSMIRSLVVYICVQGPSSALFSVKVIPLGFCILSSCQLHNVFLARYDRLTPLGLQMKQWGQNTPLEYMWATHQCVISKCIYNQHVQHWWSSRTHFLHFLVYSVGRRDGSVQLCLRSNKTQRYYSLPDSYRWLCTHDKMNLRMCDAASSIYAGQNTPVENKIASWYVCVCVHEIFWGCCAFAKVFSIAIALTIPKTIRQRNCHKMLGLLFVISRCVNILILSGHFTPACTPMNIIPHQYMLHRYWPMIRLLLCNRLCMHTLIS